MLVAVVAPPAGTLPTVPNAVGAAPCGAAVGIAVAAALPAGERPRKNELPPAVGAAVGSPPEAPPAGGGVGVPNCTFGCWPCGSCCGPAPVKLEPPLALGPALGAAVGAAVGAGVLGSAVPRVTSGLLNVAVPVRLSAAVPAATPGSEQ